MLDVVPILEKLQEINLIKLHKVTGSYYTIYCPMHNNGNERRPSCGVLIREEYRNGQKYPAGFVHCFTCGYVNTLPGLITDLLKARSITQTGVEWLIANIPGFVDVPEFELLVPDNLMNDLSDKFAVNYVRSLIETPVSYVSEEELSRYRYTVPYMYERKLTDEIISKFDIGFDANWIPTGRKRPVPCITFPVRDRQGRTLFIYRRAIDTKFFSAPDGSQKPVYGIDMVPKGTKELFITESIINALTLWTWGYTAVALMGTGNPYQLSQLKELGVREIVLCMDGDEAGSKATQRLKRALSSTALVWAVNMIPGKDVNDLTKSEFDELYVNRE